MENWILAASLLVALVTAFVAGHNVGSRANRDRVRGALISAWWDGLDWYEGCDPGNSEQTRAEYIADGLLERCTQRKATP